MREFLAAVLTVIAMGVLLIAYTLSGSRVPAPGAGFVQYDPRVDSYGLARPAAAERIDWTGDPYALRAPIGYQADRRAAASEPSAQAVPARRRVSSSRSAAQLERGSGRDWEHTAMIVGGSTAAGAGVGAVLGGKKGALVGAALGGGASTLYEATRR
jgi:hypothetical protein